MGGRISIHEVKTEDQTPDSGTKQLRKHRHSYLIKLMIDFMALLGELYIINRGRVSEASSTGDCLIIIGGGCFVTDVCYETPR